jgi:hypothetical protein
MSGSVCDEPVVHMVIPGNSVAGSSVCRNAIVAGTGPGRGLRDLAVFIPGGVEHHQGIPYDNSPDDPPDGTWHPADWCPYQSRPDAVKAALARSHRTPDGALCAVDHPHPGGTCGTTRSDQPEGTAEDGVRVVTVTRPDDPAARLEQYALILSALDLAASGTPTHFINEHGYGLVTVIPAAEYHDPRTCCCQHCPWGGNHGTT